MPRAVPRSAVAVVLSLLGAACGHAQSVNRFYFDVQVDKPARPAPANPAPHYPDSLSAAGVAGSATVSFMVDATGHVEPSVFVVVRSSHPQFTQAVRDVLPRLAFAPAELAGHKVRERVTQRFDFSLPDRVVAVSPPATSGPGGSARWYSGFQVDKEAALLPGAPAPAYPDSLRAAGFTGRVIAIFNVDTLGHTEPSTFAVIDSWSPLFTRAVRDVIPHMAFVPAELFGHKVRQQVQQRFDFALPGKPAPEAFYSPERAGQKPQATTPARQRTETSEEVAFQTFFASQVDKEVAIAAGSPMPKYPDGLRASALKGEVLAQFVVDSMGRPAVGSLQVVRSSHDLFTQSVRAALPTMKFTPAEVNGHRARQLVQHLFTFEPPHPPPAEPRARG